MTHTTDTQIWQSERCAVCGGGFTSSTWDERHTWLVDDESDIHAECCECHGRDDTHEDGNQ